MKTKTVRLYQGDTSMPFWELFLGVGKGVGTVFVLNVWKYRIKVVILQSICVKGL